MFKTGPFFGENDNFFLFAKETCRIINFDAYLAIELFEQFVWYRMVEKAHKGHDMFKVVVFFQNLTVFDISKKNT